MALKTMMSVLDDRFRLVEEIVFDELMASPSASDSGEFAQLPFKNDRTRVYRAEDLQSGQAVVIKIMVHPSTKVAEFRSRFQRDSAIMHSFEHPNVVKTIASGITPEGQPYLAMEFLKGQTLAAKIDQNRAIPPQQMAEILQQVASAIDAAHAKGIVHRDINPDAIMIQDAPDGTINAKLLDFGLAKESTKETPSNHDLTSKETALGKAAYLSPEQARGGEIDARSDVYALGVTLYQALTGRLPFEGETDFQILLAKINGSVLPFPEGWSDDANAQAIESVVLKALSKEPADRPATAGAFALLFQEALHSRGDRKFRLSGPMIVVGAVVVTALVLIAKWPF